MTEHKWVNPYETCEYCNYGKHLCYFCGEYLDHESYDSDGNLHDVAFCRPDLVEHEPGPMCTWPATGDAEFDAEYGHPACYWDHENNVLRNTIEEVAVK